MKTAVNSSMLFCYEYWQWNVVPLIQTLKAIKQQKLTEGCKIVNNAWKKFFVLGSVLRNNKSL
jgi:hypothetical protein